MVYSETLRLEDPWLWSVSFHISGFMCIEWLMMRDHSGIGGKPAELGAGQLQLDSPGEWWLDDPANSCLCTGGLGTERGNILRVERERIDGWCGVSGFLSVICERALMFLQKLHTMPCLSKLSWSANTVVRPAAVRGPKFPRIEAIGSWCTELQHGAAIVGSLMQGVSSAT